MLPSISQHERFKSDCKRYREAIEQSTDPQIKDTLSNLLRKLMSEANRIDQFYNELSTGAGMPSHIEESRSSLTSVRQELERVLASLKL
jgi:molecular chaperone GrpE (heat shock protein)